MCDNVGTRELRASISVRGEYVGLMIDWNDKCKRRVVSETLNTPMKGPPPESPQERQSVDLV
jgi:hypothetical protein